MLYGLYLNQDANTLLDWFRETGHPVGGYFHLAFWAFSNPILAYKVVVFSCILIATLLIYVFARRIRIFSPRECLFIAVIFCCYPAYQVHPEIIMAPSMFYYGLFLVSAYIALRAVESTGWTAVVMRVLSLVLFALSFQVGSLLVFYFPCLLFLLLVRQKQYVLKTPQELLGSALRYGDFFLLPFVYWGLNQWLRTPYGVYAGYNQPSFQPENWPAHFELFLDGAITSQILNAWQLFLNHRLLAIVLGMIFILSVLILDRSRNKQPADNPTGQLIQVQKSLKSTLYILLFALALLFCAIFPYVAVGKYATAMGWGTRFSLLIGLPIGIGLIALGRFLTLALPGITVKTILLFLGAFLASAFILATIDAYIRLQARWVKDSSIIVNLRTLPKETIGPVNVFIVDDQYRIPANDSGYNFYEYAGIFKLAWNEEKRVGFIPSVEMDPATLIQQYPKRRYLLKEFRVDGCRAILHINRGFPAMSHVQLVATYFKYRWFQPNNLETFLHKVTLLNITNSSCEAPVK